MAVASRPGLSIVIKLVIKVMDTETCIEEAL